MGFLECIHTNMFKVYCQEQAEGTILGNKSSLLVQEPGKIVSIAKKLFKFVWPSPLN